MTKDKQKIAEKIRHLREKTVENGCTEAEAMSAMEMAARMAEKHEITEQDLAMERVMEETRESRNRNTRKTPHIATVYCVNPICKLLGVKGWKSGATAVFFGFESDVIVAEYLYDVCKTAIDSGWKQFLRDNPGYSKRERADQSKAFSHGMAWRLAERIKELDWQKMKRTEERGERALVLVDAKIAAVENALQVKKPWLKLTKAKRRSVSFYDGKAFDAGKNAANNVNISRGVDARRAAQAPRLT